MMRSVVLASRPLGNPVEAYFALSEAPLPAVTKSSFLEPMISSRWTLAFVTG